jgi:hypothetical protein
MSITRSLNIGIVGSNLALDIRVLFSLSVEALRGPIRRSKTAVEPHNFRINSELE